MHEEDLERRRVNWDSVLESIHRIELKAIRIESHMKSELGGEGSTGSINYQLNEIRKDLDRIITNYEKKIEQIELRLNMIEQNYWRFVGGAAVGLFLINMFLKWFIK